MKLRKQSLLIWVILAPIICRGSVVIADYILNYPPLLNYLALQDRDTPTDVGDAFTTALRLNHPAAYELTDPKLWPRVDEWMATHEVKECKRWSGWLGFGSSEEYTSNFNCVRKGGGSYYFRVVDIMVEDGRVVDWEKVEEEP